jgi:crossover junction endodeoxyribonuclease RuvC
MGDWRFDENKSPENKSPFANRRSPMVVLGVDPGSRAAGYALLKVEGRDRERVLDAGTLRFDGSTPHALRLREIYRRLGEIVEECPPDEGAVEMPVYGKNPQSMLKLGRAQAATMLVLLNRDVPVNEYTPKEVKKSVTGGGNATKQQVQYMVCSMLGLEASELSYDASDALAVALCHAHRGSAQAGAEQHEDWAAFAEANPDRIG